MDTPRSADGHLSEFAATEETLDVLSDPVALMEIRQAEAEVDCGDVVRGVETVRALRSLA